MPADLTREQLDRYRYPGMHFLDKGGLDVTVARGMFEHLLEIAEAHLSEPTRIAVARAGGYREGVEAAKDKIKIKYEGAEGNLAEAVSRQDYIAAGRYETQAQAFSVALASVRALTPPPAEPAQPSGMSAEQIVAVLGDPLGCVEIKPAEPSAPLKETE